MCLTLLIARGIIMRFITLLIISCVPVPCSACFICITSSNLHGNSLGAMLTLSQTGRLWPGEIKEVRCLENGVGPRLKPKFFLFPPLYSCLLYFSVVQQSVCGTPLKSRLSLVLSYSTSLSLTFRISSKVQVWQKTQMIQVMMFVKKRNRQCL